MRYPTFRALSRLLARAAVAGMAATWWTSPAR